MLFYRIKYPFALFLSLNCLLLANAFATPSHDQDEANIAISALYHTLKNIPTNDVKGRLDFISQQFLGKKYLLGALGEGPTARYDQAPRYRVDAFDCDTFVTTTLALALAENLNNFKQCLSRIRYKNGKVSYLSRNHFTSVDWNANNQKQGILKDITLSFKDEAKQAVATYAVAVIDKPSWHKHHPLNTIRLYPANPKEQQRRLAELQEKGSTFTKEISKIPYLPFTALFDKQGQANQVLFSQIPQAAIIEIIRPNWALYQKIGTNLNVSHLGFAFWKDNTLVFRQASSLEGKVIDTSLIDYLRQAQKNPTIKGINVQIVLEKNC